MVPALVVVGEPEQRPVGVRQPDVGHEIAHEHPGGSAPAAPVVGQGVMHGGPAARRGAKVCGLCSRHGDFQEEPVHLGRRVSGGGHVEIDVTKPSNSTCVRAANRKPAAMAVPREICLRLHVAAQLGWAGGTSISLPSFTTTKRMGAASWDTPPLITRRAIPSPSSESVRFHTPTSPPFTSTGVQGGITLSETPTLLFIHAAA